MSAPQDLAQKMAEKSDQELLAMLETPADWTPEALDAAKAELKTRDTDTKASPLHQTPPVQKSKEAVPITVTTQFLAWRAMLVSTIWAGDKLLQQAGISTQMSLALWTLKLHFAHIVSF